MNDCTLSIDCLSRRIANLEKQNRRLKQTGVSLILCVGMLVLMGQAESPQVIRAKSFVVVDDAGRKRAELGMGGSAGLVVYDENGVPQISLDTSPFFGASLGLYHGGTYPLLKLQATSEGADFSLYAPKDTSRPKVGGIEPRVRLEFSDLLGGGQLVLENPDSKSSNYVSLNDLEPEFVIADQKGYTVTIGASHRQTKPSGESHLTSAASVVLSDSKGHVIWRTP